MNRNTRTLIVIGVAVLTASLASFGIYRAVQAIPVRTVEIATRHAVVAAKPLTMGAMLTKDSVKLVDWPAQSPLTGGFSEVSEVLDRGLLASVIQNEPIVESKIAAKGAGAGLPPSIPSGMLAMSVKVNEVIGVAGFVVPGTHVDVIVIIRQPADSVSRIVVSNVQVLTAGTKYDQDNSKDAKPIASTVVTLIVAPPDAERIALAQSEGQIMLALRNPMDMLPSESHGVRTAGLIAVTPPSDGTPKAVVKRAARVEPTPPLPPAPPAPKIYSVEAIRASKRTEEVVR